MNLFLLLALMSVTCGSKCSLKPPPPYVESKREILAAEEVIKDRILSMAKHVPHLNDSRRHYAEITHVIYSIAYKIGHSCIPIDYDKIYQPTVNKAASEAISNLLKVVKTAKKFLDDLNAKTDSIKKLIKTIGEISSKDTVSNSLLDVIIANNPEKYKKQAELLLAAGKNAKEFNNKKDTFNEVSKELDAHKYVIKGSEELKSIIEALSDVIRLIHPNYVRC